MSETLGGETLLRFLGEWEKRELQAERAATYARAQQARIIGQLANQGVHLFPPLEYEELPDEPTSM